MTVSTARLVTGEFRSNLGGKVSPVTVTTVVDPS